MSSNPTDQSSRAEEAVYVKQESLSPSSTSDAKPAQKKRSYKLCFLISAIVLLLAGAAIAITLSVVLTRSQKSSTEASPAVETTSAVVTEQSTNVTDLTVEEEEQEEEEDEETKYFTNWGTGKSSEEWKSRIIYHVLTDRFQRTDGRNTSCTLTYYDFCGGSWLGLVDKLDYIKNLGCNAIWISNVVKNTPRGYHGYWPQDWFSVQTEGFGGPNELKKLVIECHKRDIWVMVDYVYNHAGDVGSSYSRITTFPKQEYYHDYCVISNWEDEWQAKNCRYTSGLPDLNQDHPYVTETLINATKWLLQTYHIDGFRVDTAKHIKVDFFKQLIKAVPDVYFLGEVTYGNPADLRNYTSVMTGALNFPMWHTITDILWYHQTMKKIRYRMDELYNNGIDAYALGTFIDNHDKKRWLNEHPNYGLYKTALVLDILGASIPIIYYGTEQGYNGGDDPWNREVLWSSGFNQNHELYKFIQTAAKARRLIGKTDWQTERYAEDNFYAYSRGPVLVCTANTEWVTKYVTYLPAEFKPPSTIIEIFTGETRTIYDWNVKVEIKYGNPQVWVPLDLWNQL